MLLGTNKNLNDLMIEGLLAKDSPVSEIQAYLKAQNTKASIQGIYKALRELIAEDIVVKQKKIYSINNIWREKAANLFSKKYQFKLSPGEQVIYRFTKLLHLDAFWKHTLSDIGKETGDFPTFDALPHQFWFYAYGRRQSELEYTASFDAKKIYLFSIIGGITELDKKMKAIAQSDYHQIHLTDKSPFGRRDNITIMDSYIITTKISAKLSREIDDLYNKVENEETLEKKLNELFANSGIIKLTVEHNSKKARLLRKRMAADFYIPKEVQEKFELF